MSGITSVLITTPYIDFFPYVSSFTSGNTSGHVISLPAGNPGDMLLLMSGNGGQIGATGWSNVVVYDGVAFGAIGRIADGTEGTSVTCTGTTIDRWFCVRIANYQNGLANVGVFHSNGSSSATLTAPVTSPAWGGDNDLVITVGNASTVSSYTARPTGFTSLGTKSNFWMLGCDWGWKTGSTVTPTNYTTSSSSTTWWYYTFVLH